MTLKGWNGTAGGQWWLTTQSGSTQFVYKPISVHLAQCNFDARRVTRLREISQVGVGQKEGLLVCYIKVQF